MLKQLIVAACWVVLLLSLARDGDAEEPIRISWSVVIHPRGSEPMTVPITMDTGRLGLGPADASGWACRHRRYQAYLPGSVPAEGMELVCDRGTSAVITSVMCARQRYKFDGTVIVLAVLNSEQHQFERAAVLTLQCST
jgi:hypothetical protein